MTEEEARKKVSDIFESIKQGTFTEEMAQHIDDVYRKLWEEKIKWLEDKNKEEQV